MAYAIFGGLLVLLVAGLVAAVATAARARRELEDLEVEFAEHRGVAHDESEPAPWSSYDLDDLRGDVTEVAGHDPYATLTRANSAVTWHASKPNGLEPEPNLWGPEPNGSEPKPTADPEPAVDLAPIEDRRPVAWRPTVDAPVIVLVVGAGFLGTGMTASATTASRLRRAWGEINDSFAEAGVITLDTDAEPTARPSYDPGSTHDDVAVADTPSWPRPRRRSVDSFPPPEEDSRISRPPRSNRLRPKPTADPKPIAWRPPTTRR
jgi:hypothetical protein